MTIANLGLAAVFLLVPWLYIALEVAGAAYLLHLAWKTLRPGGTSLFEPAVLKRHSRWTLVRMGLVTNLLNPEAAIMYMALIPQFVDPALGHTALQGFVLGGVQISISIVVNAGIILAAGTIASSLVEPPHWMRWQRRVTGTLLGAVGIRVALDAPTSAHA